MPENKVKQTLLAILAVLIWLASSIAAFFLILPILDSVITIYAAFWADPNPVGQAFFLGTTIRNVGVMILAVLFVIAVIGGAEYHTRHFNTPKSWHFMFLTCATELCFFLFTVFF